MSNPKKLTRTPTKRQLQALLRQLDTLRPFIESLAETPAAPPAKRRPAPSRCHLAKPQS